MLRYTFIALAGFLFFTLSAKAVDFSSGPIWNQADAQKKCPSICGAQKDMKWNGHWKTTVAGKESVCGCVLAVTPEEQNLIEPVLDIIVTPEPNKPIPVPSLPEPIVIVPVKDRCVEYCQMTKDNTWTGKTIMVGNPKREKCVCHRIPKPQR